MAVLPFPQPDGSRTERVMQVIRDRIDRRVLVPGAKVTGEFLFHFKLTINFGYSGVG